MRLVASGFGEGRHRFHERRPRHDVPRAVHHAVLVPDPLALLDRRRPGLLRCLEHDGKRARLFRRALHAVDGEGDAARVRLAPRRRHRIVIVIIIVLIIVVVVVVVGVLVEGPVGVVGGVLVVVVAADFRLGLHGGGFDLLLGRAVPSQQHVHGDLALLFQRAHLRADRVGIERRAIQLLPQRLHVVLVIGVVRGGELAVVGVARAQVESRPGRGVVVALDLGGGTRAARSSRAGLSAAASRVAASGRGWLPARGGGIGGLGLDDGRARGDLPPELRGRRRGPRDERLGSLGLPPAAPRRDPIGVAVILPAAGARGGAPAPREPQRHRRRGRRASLKPARDARSGMRDQSLCRSPAVLPGTRVSGRIVEARDGESRARGAPERKKLRAANNTRKI